MKPMISLTRLRFIESAAFALIIAAAAAAVDSIALLNARREIAIGGGHSVRAAV